jgi:hypothetical protein
MSKVAHYVTILLALLPVPAQAEPPSQRLQTALESARVESERNIAGYRPGTPLPDSLRSLPCVKHVKIVEPKRASQTVVHLRDWHFLTRDVFDADVQSVNDEPISTDELDELYEDFLREVEQVQAEQMALLRCLIRHHGLRQVCSEGLTKRDVLIFKAKIGVMKKLESELPGYRRDLADAKLRLLELRKEGQTDSDECRINEKLADEIEALFYQHRLELLRIGTAGRLLMAGELAAVLPIENDAPFEAANPVGKDGSVTLDAKKNERREDAQVRNLLKGGPLVVVVLGGAHDLTDNIIRLADEKCRYVSVTTHGFEAASGERQ